jgi:hypothetical protein
MKLFLDKNQGYALQVNKDARKVILSDLYSPVAKTAAEGVEEKEVASKVNAALVDHYKSRFKQFDFVWRNNGMDVDGSAMTIQDMWSVPDAPVLMPREMSSIVREAIEPMLVGTSLLQRINYTMGQTILLPSYGALSVAGLDIPEGGEYPESKATQGGASMVAAIGKSGIAVKISEEMIRYSQIDVMSMHLRSAGRCLARHKETKIFNMIGAQGTAFYDNANPQDSVLGVTHGRGFNGAANGSVTAEDLFDLWGHLLARGFMANTLLVHPLTYTMYLKDANMRTMFFNQGSNTLFASYNPRSAMGGNPWGEAAGGQSVGQIQNILPDTQTELRNQDISSAPSLPGYLGLPLSVIVSPLVKYDPVRKLTDIMLFDRNELGVLLVDEELTTEEWNDPARDIRKVKLRERYALGILNEGQGVALIRNAVNVDNMISSQPAVPQINVAALNADGSATASGGLEVIPERTPIV